VFADLQMDDAKLQELLAPPAAAIDDDASDADMEEDAGQAERSAPAAGAAEAAQARCLLSAHARSSRSGLCCEVCAARSVRCTAQVLCRLRCAVCVLCSLRCTACVLCADAEKDAGHEERSAS
jgi:hypothetical protein